ncbi:myogenesis-regulating glycosidase isoform X2 [Coccinella septempunctata]|uniref:myogenesis-regulating glycosidase isoform X2 n=1 Tax=Coccinella septempunctata TaxID=41139 RepID=UPI001D095A39|nr:myogenesis-regulating glycosidase isoform X2 [Coccinella septempunctata]
MFLNYLALASFLILAVRSEIIYSGDGKSKLQTRYVPNDGMLLELIVGNETKLSGHIGRNITFKPKSCHDTSCSFTDSRDFIITITIFYDSFNIEWFSFQNPNISNATFTDCFDLNSTKVSWYGGPEVLDTAWPIEKLKFNNRPYISSKLDNGAVVDPYWLNSKGGFIWVNSTVPLFVDQNNEEKDKVCFKSAVKSPYKKFSNFLSYNIAAKNNSRDAHLFAVNRYIGKPKRLPDARMVREPIWTTWGKYKAEINDSSVRAFLLDIYRHNFTKGQIEIDDKWEVCYGDQVFDTKSRFRKINETVKMIHDHGFRATLWTHPFVNTNCARPVQEGITGGLFVNSSTGNAVTSWWNGNSSYVIDFTNPLASEWFKSRLMKLHYVHGIDGFKCDAGENDWLPNKPIFDTSYEDEPNSFTRLYVTACSELGGLVEVRSGFRTQDLQVFVRMLDKDSVWGNNNGLKALVHSLLQFNMIGYTFVLPDLVGGNGYNGTIPTPELLVRWTQANAFMPSLQFSYLPWELDEAPFNTTEIVRNFTNLHEKYSDVILEAMLNSTRTGAPVNPPIWWIDPTDPVAHKVDDEFLLGEKILIAPVLEKGAKSRDVYLPKGIWRDGNNYTLYEGRRTLRRYAAPINILPYFIRIHEQ